MMAGDYTRLTFDAHDRYSGVLTQQGRVQLDSDWNEAIEIIKRRVRTLALDNFGPVGLPRLTTPDAFLIDLILGPSLDLSIEPGRLYVEGWLAELFGDEGTTYLAQQPFFPDPPPLPAAGDAVVYLDVWEREVTYIEAPTLLDVALGGADTATRTQTVWQVKVEARDGAACGQVVGEPPSAGRLTSEAVAPPAPDDPCILPPQVGYRGLENRLYRVEIHEGGPLGTARFKWSRDNGSIVSAVSAIAVAGGQTTLTVNRIGRDPVLRFSKKDWVTVTDDHRELHGEPGEMARIVDIDETQSRVVLDRALPTAGGRPFGANADELADRHTRVQRWDQTAATNILDADGLIDTAAGPIDLEAGVRIRFSTDPAGGEFRNGDYWVFAARTADASVERLTEAPPRGIHHHYVQLAAITGLGGANPQVFDCRPRPEDLTATCCCCLITVGAREDQQADFTTLAGAVAALPNLAPDPSVRVIICVLGGDHQIPATVQVRRPRVTIRGCGWGTRLLPQQGPAIALNGEEQAVEALAIEAENESPLIEITGRQQRVESCFLRNDGPGPSVSALRVEDLMITHNLTLGGGGLDLAGKGIEVLDNDLFGGTIRLRNTSERVRIENNDLLGALEDAIILGDQGIIYDIDVLANRIRGARRNGIAGGFFDPDDQGEDGLVVGLRIVGNEIRECIDTAAEREGNAPPFGGIVLGRVYDLVARDNRIERNGLETRAAVCGIYVRHSRGVEITHNIIRQNGARPDGQALPGPQAGISLRDANVILEGVPDPEDDERLVAELGILPAARIADNLVEARRGPALYIRGMGPMTVEGNRFQATDILGDFTDDTFATLDQYIGTVFLFNAGLPAYWGGFLAGAGVPGLITNPPNRVTGTPLLTALTVGGQTQFRGNQVRFNLARAESEVVLANVAIIALDDTVIAGNQTEGVLVALPRGANNATTLAPQFQMDVMFTDLLNIAVTTRQIHNGLMSTPFLTMFSILSFGIFNHCVDNQTTSCILAVGSSPKSVVRDNAVLFPHPLFCEDED